MRRKCFFPEYSDRRAQGTESHPSAAPLEIMALAMSYTGLLVGWLVLFALLLFVLLFGEAEVFEGTVVEKAHWLVTDGVPYAASWVLRKGIGDAAGAKIEAFATEVLFDRPNPAMQLIYVALVMGGYWVYCVHVEPLIGVGAVSEAHALVVPFAMLISIASWLTVCFSDPGTVNAYTLDAQLATYPHDHVLYEPKICPTLGVTCPARSKFCRVTQKRVAKFDHYCGWMGNSIGENNLRYFVSFLGIHVVLTSYGSWLCCSAISGEIERRGLWAAAFEPSVRGAGVVTLASDWRLLTKFVAFHFAAAATLSLFLVILAVMLGAFLVYHLWMISKGLTTNETFKWKDYERWARRTAAERASGSKTNADGSVLETPTDDPFVDDDERDVGCVGASVLSEIDAPEGGDPDGSSKGFVAHLFSSGGGGSKNKKLKIELPKNIYDKGSFLANLREVYFPPSKEHERRLNTGVRDKKRQ